MNATSLARFAQGASLAIMIVAVSCNSVSHLPSAVNGAKPRGQLPRDFGEETPIRLETQKPEIETTESPSLPLRMRLEDVFEDPRQLRGLILSDEVDVRYFELPSSVQAREFRFSVADYGLYANPIP